MQSITALSTSFCQGANQLFVKPLINKTARLAASLFEKIGAGSVGAILRSHPLITTCCLLVCVASLAWKYFFPNKNRKTVECYKTLLTPGVELRVNERGEVFHEQKKVALVVNQDKQRANLDGVHVIQKGEDDFLPKVQVIHNKLILVGRNQMIDQPCITRSDSYQKPALTLTEKVENLYELSKNNPNGVDLVSNEKGELTLRGKEEVVALLVDLNNSPLDVKGGKLAPRENEALLPKMKTSKRDHTLELHRNGIWMGTYFTLNEK